jgi:hypothetical protein
MKKFVLLLMTILLFTLNYGCSKQSGAKKITIQKCQNECSEINDPNFCSRICEKEILDPRWKFFGFDKQSGSALFYDLESIFTSNNTVFVWMKRTYSEKERQDKIKQNGGKYKELDFVLKFLEIDCSKRRLRLLSFKEYDFNGSIINQKEIPEFLSSWWSIPPSSMGEELFKEVCKKSGK